MKFDVIAMTSSLSLTTSSLYLEIIVLSINSALSGDSSCMERLIILDSRDVETLIFSAYISINFSTGVS